MFLRFHFINMFFLHVLADLNCSDLETRSNFKFYLIRSYQRSTKERLFVDNVDSLEACKVLTRKYRGLAFNYSPNERFKKRNEGGKIFRDHYWEQPQLYFNCHILKCPESETFKTMVDDAAYDYFSLYENPIALDYVCLPEIGLFILHTNPESFQNASLKCRHIHDNCGTLAHVVSEKRTDALTGLMSNYNEQQQFQIKSRVYLAYVGLQYNLTEGHNLDFFNEEKESLKCFSYRAWHPGNPQWNSEFNNASCVALTIKRSWKIVKCERRLPFICELWTSCGNKENTF